MPAAPPAGPFEGRLVRLEPLVDAHVDDLVVAAGEDRDGFRFTAVPDGPAATADYVEALRRAAARGETAPFAVRRRADGRVVGVTRYLSFRRQPAARAPWAVEIGGTWLARSAWGSGLNPEAKLLLLGHAFEAWEVDRVDFKTDARNQRSRQALLGIGARFEGVLRRWQPSLVAGEEGTRRDSAMYSVLADEWPDVRARLERRVGPPGRPPA